MLKANCRLTNDTVTYVEDIEYDHIQKRKKLRRLIDGNLNEEEQIKQSSDGKDEEL